MGRGEVASKQKDIATLKAEIDRLVNAIATAQSAPEAVVRAITERQERLNALEADLRAAQRAPAAITAELKAMRESAQRRIRDLRAVLDRNPDEARAVMQALFAGPLRFTPTEEADGRRYRVTGTASIRSLLEVTEGGSSRFTKSASPAGFEPASPA